MNGPMHTDNKNLIWAEYALRLWGRVLELGPLNGCDTVSLATNCDRLISVEGRLSNLTATAQAVAEAGLLNVSIVYDNLETIDLRAFDWFECAWASGVLYHLPRPWEFVKKLYYVTDTVFGWSHVSESIACQVEDYRGRYIDEPVENPLAGLSPKSFWLVPRDFERMFADCGYTDFRWLSEPSPHVNGGLAGQFVAKY